jgi:serine/threonine protein phosphatase 1
LDCRTIEEVPSDVLAWVGALPTWHEDDLRIFVHAGLRPGRERRDQLDRDRLWIRDEFLVGDHDFGKFVVHGHTPQLRGRPDLRRLRVNLDTGAVYGGQLSAGVFDDVQAAPLRFLQVSA